MAALFFLLLLLPHPKPAAFTSIGVPPHCANATSMMQLCSPLLEAAPLPPPSGDDFCVAVSSSICGGNFTLVVLLIRYPTSGGFLSGALFSFYRNVPAGATTIAIICPGTMLAAAASLPSRRQTRQLEQESNIAFTLPVPDKVPPLPTTMVPSPPPPPAAPMHPLTPLGPERKHSSGTSRMRNLHLARVRFLVIFLQLLLIDPGEGQQVIFDGINL